MNSSLKNALFISDIHLTEDRPDCIRAFFDFLDWIPDSFESLFILGDFFEYWVGDDVQSDLSKKISKRLSEVSHSKNLKLFFIVGNRDFSVGHQFANQCNMRLLKDESIFNIAGKTVCVTHGDQYCTDDKGYQIFRKIIRNKLVLTTLLLLSRKKRVQIAENLRAKSKAKFKNQPTYVDVNQQAVEKAFRRLGCELIVHGHTHMADIHLATDSETNTSTRVVLGDWHKVGWYCEINEAGPSLSQFSINNPVF